jgi:hypothetical protein
VEKLKNRAEELNKELKARRKNQGNAEIELSRWS